MENIALFLFDPPTQSTLYIYIYILYIYIYIMYIYKICYENKQLDSV